MTQIKATVFSTIVSNKSNIELNTTTKEIINEKLKTINIAIYNIQELPTGQNIKSAILETKLKQSNNYALTNPLYKVFTSNYKTVETGLKEAKKPVFLIPELTTLLAYLVYTIHNLGISIEQASTLWPVAEEIEKDLWNIRSSQEPNIEVDKAKSLYIYKIEKEIPEKSSDYLYQRCTREVEDFVHVLDCKKNKKNDKKIIEEVWKNYCKLEKIQVKE
ncbi:44449_t:CDS:2, partial [Gigaspora margarita]